MRKSLVVLACVLFSGLVLIIGCNKPQEKQSDPAAKTEEAKKSEQIEKTKATSDQQATDSEGAESAPADSDIPQYITDMVKHINEINSIVKGNMDNCAKVVELMRDYLEKNQEGMKAFQQAAKEAQESMSADQRTSFAQQMTRVVTPLLQETAKVQMEFTQKCQKEAQKMSEIMGKMQDSP